MVKVTIGSAASNNVVLNHPSISPNHLEIVQDDQGNFLLTDYNSLYGTFVNGYRVQGIVQLRPTDTVNAGQVPLPWRNYFMYQAPVQNVVPPQPSNYFPPVGNIVQNPQQPIPPTDQSTVPPAKTSKKKILFFVGGGVLFILLSIVAILYFYTRPSYQHLKFIPSNAFVVTSIDFKSIAGKIDLDKMQKLDFFMDMKDHARDENEILSKALGDPLTTGVDIFSQPYGFMCIESGDYPKFNGGVVFAIKNENDFDRFVVRLSKGAEIRRTDNFNFLDLEGESCVAWNKNGGIIYFSDRSSSRKENYCRSLLEQETDASILSNESFEVFKKASYDIGFFVNYDGIHSLPGFTLPSYMRGASAMATITFNDGKLSYASEYFPSKQNASSNSNNFMGKKGINDALKNSIPGNSYGVATLSVDLKALYDYMNQDAKFTQALDEMARGLEVDRTELAGLLSGEAYVSLADVKETVVERQDFNYDYETNQFDFVKRMDTTLVPSMVFGFTAKDSKTIDNVIAKSNPKDTSGGIHYWSIYYGLGNFYVSHHDANYFFSNDFSIAQQLNASGKTATPLPQKMSNFISLDPMYSYFNLNITKYPAVLPKYFEKDMRSKDYSSFHTFISMFDYAELVGDGVKQNLDIYFTDKGNCLNTFLKVGNEMYVQNRNR